MIFHNQHISFLNMYVLLCPVYALYSVFIFFQSWISWGSQLRSIFSGLVSQDAIKRCKGVAYGDTWSQGYRKKVHAQQSMKFFLLINAKLPTNVGILTFMSGKNSILGFPEPEEN